MFGLEIYSTATSEDQFKMQISERLLCVSFDLFYFTYHVCFNSHARIK